MTDIFLTDKDKQELDAKIESKEPKGSWPLSVEKGGTGATSVEQVLANLGLTNFAKAQRVSYVGTGEVGSDNPVQITFSFPPKAVFYISDNPPASYITHMDMVACPTEYTEGWGFGYSDHHHGKKSPDGKTLYFYTIYDEAYKANNAKGSTYSYLAIG